MVLVLVLGDLHIPHRSAELPAKFRALLVPGKIQHVLCTGNLADGSTLEYLKSLCPDVHVVRGDCDDAFFLPGAGELPESKVVSLGDFRVGLCHGHQLAPCGDSEALGALQRQLDCDVLVTGHTHAFATFEAAGKLYVNPGTATGACPSTARPGEEQPPPSFMLMDLQGPCAVTYVYELNGGEVSVRKIEHRKAEA